MVSKKSSNSFLQRNGLSVVLAAFLVIFLSGQAMAGWTVANSDREDHNLPKESLGSYLHSGHFIGALFENWESVFLQMWMYVLLTVWLRQEGSSESKKLDEAEEVDRNPKPHPQAPWPVRKGGPWLYLNSNSLSLAFLGLFLLSFLAHSYGSWRQYNFQSALDDKAAVTWTDFVASSQFWFESFQNWQSEFLAVLSIVVLSIWLRQHGSPESKPVDAPHSQTGD